MPCRMFFRIVFSRQPSQEGNDRQAKALILSGDIRIATAASERVYQAGDVFHLAAQEPHSEFYGMLGVQYLVRRKTPPAA